MQQENNEEDEQEEAKARKKRCRGVIVCVLLHTFFLNPGLVTCVVRGQALSNSDKQKQYPTEINNCQTIDNDIPATKGFKQFQPQTKGFQEELTARFTQNTLNRHCGAGQEKWCADSIFMKVHPFSFLISHLYAPALKHSATAIHCLPQKVQTKENRPI